jgi:hypothetical protein
LVQANKTRDLPRYGLNLKSIPAVCRPCRFRASAHAVTYSCFLQQQWRRVGGPRCPLPPVVCPLSSGEGQPQHCSSNGTLALWRQHRIAKPRQAFCLLSCRPALRSLLYGSRIPFEIHADLATSVTREKKRLRVIYSCRLTLKKRVRLRR